MKKIKDEMRAEYKRSDFTKLERGKFYKAVAKGTSVALLGLLTLTEQTACLTSRPKRTARKTV